MSIVSRIIGLTEAKKLRREWGSVCHDVRVSPVTGQEFAKGGSGPGDEPIEVPAIELSFRHNNMSTVEYIPADYVPTLIASLQDAAQAHVASEPVATEAPGAELT
jgi:hypothetical protein